MSEKLRRVEYWLTTQDGHVSVSVHDAKYGAFCWYQEAHAIEQERDDLRAQKYHLQDRIAALETEVAEIRGSTSFGKHIAIEQERDMLLAAIDSDDVNWLTALRDIRRAMKGYKK